VTQHEKRVTSHVKLTQEFVIKGRRVGRRANSLLSGVAL
jgi:hypothetical protein